MSNSIIYSVSEQKQPQQSLISRICSCLKLFRSNKQINNVYRPEIDTPKSSFLGQKKMIVLDLDETLVHSQFQPIDGYDFTLEITVQAQQFKVYVTIRPGAQEFIEQLHEYYDIILWTASLQEYADPVMDYLDPQKMSFARLYRDSCTPIKGGLTKNLAILGRDLKDILIVDNSMVSFCLNPTNGFKIKDFYFDKLDRELEYIIPFLIWISQLPDVRPVSLLYEQYQNSSSEQLNQRKLGQLAPFELQKFGLISKSLTFQKEKKQKSSSVIRTLTLSKNEEEEIDELTFRQKVGLNSPVNEKAQDQTIDCERETFEISG